jgi:5-methylcytosine-specific restriction endonuclease McrA
MHHACHEDNPLSVDHIIQRQHGGTDDPANLHVLCLSCNHSRPHHNPTQP